MELKNDYFIRLKTKNQIARRNSAYIKMMAENEENKFIKDTLLRRAERIRNCLNYWEWARYDKSKVLDLLKVSRCKDLYCPNCRAFGLGKYLLKVVPIFQENIKFYRPYMITLTVPNVFANELKSTIEKMNKVFRDFWRKISNIDKNGYKDRLFDCVGAIKVLELTFNYKTRKYHPHFHVIVFIDNDVESDFVKHYGGGWQYNSESFIYYSEADLMIQRLWTMVYYDLREYELKELDEKQVLVCDIRDIKMPEGLYEVFKYVFKDDNINGYPIFKTVFEALKNKRLKQGYGNLFNINEKEIDDEIDNEEELKYFIKNEEEFMIYRSNNIMEPLINFKDYKKISRYNKDNEYYNKIKEY